MSKRLLMVCVIVVQVSSVMHRSHAYAPCDPGTPWRLAICFDLRSPRHTKCGTRHAVFINEESSDNISSGIAMATCRFVSGHYFVFSEKKSVSGSETLD